MRVLPLVMACLLSSIMAGAQGAANFVAQAETQSKAILAHLAQEQYRPAIAETVKFEQAMLAQYPAATFANDRFQSEAEHLTFTSAFPGWTAQTDTALMAAFARSAGAKLLLVTGGDGTQNRLSVFSLDVGTIFARLDPNNTNDEPLADFQFKLVTRELASNFGDAGESTAGTVGDDATLEQEIETPMDAPFTGLISLMHGKKIYFFLMESSSYTEFDTRMTALRTTVASTAFTYKPADTKKIAQLRALFADKDTPATTLDLVKALAAAGEFNEAARELSRLSQHIFTRIPAQVVSKTAIQDTAYGVTLTNPDPNKWELSLMTEGGFRGAFLRKIASTTPEGIVVLIYDALMTEGAHHDQATTVEEQQAYLRGAGRGILASFCDHIDEEGFTTVKGTLAYEVTTLSSTYDNTRVHAITTYRDGYYLNILVLTDSTRYDERMKVYNDIIASYLKAK